MGLWRMTYRRLNLAVFTLSIWLAAAAAFTSSFARGQGTTGTVGTEIFCKLGSLVDVLTGRTDQS